VILEVRGLQKSYVENSGRRLAVLKGIDFTLSAGVSLAVLGPSGCGKSTLLSCLAGLLVPDAGEIVFGGRAVNELDDDDWARLRAKEIGIIFQQFHLLGHLTALENARLPLDLAGESDKAAHARALEALTEVGLQDRIEHFPAELSRGECQRVAIARVLVNQPSLILADEPTASLDREAGRDIVDRLLTLGRQYNVALVMVTHDTEFAALCDRQVRFASGRLEV
jgi:putative ABC transport system ATP-binding protein